MESSHEYAQAVVDGEVPACKLTRLACERHINDLHRQGDEDFPYVFDEAAAARAVEFIEMLPHTKGKWAAKRELIKLEGWQKFIVESIFGWVHKDTGKRRFREAYVEVCRKNGKSVLAAAIGLYMLLCDGEFGAEVYSGATTEKQAWEVFRPAKLMCERTEQLQETFGLDVHASVLLCPADHSKFEPVIGNPGDGPSPSCAIVDEYHEHKSSDLYDTMVTGQGAREQPLTLVITTAGDNLGGPCYEKRDDCIKILNGVFVDETVFTVIYTIDEEDDWKDPKVWPKANPNLDVSVNVPYLEAQVSAAKRNPAKQGSVKTKHFNKWLGARDAWLNMEQWKALGDNTLQRTDFEDSQMVASLDMATRIDIAARVDLFWRMVDGQRHYYAFPEFYLPEAALESAPNATQYQSWVAGGHIELMDGEEIEFSEVQERVEALPVQYDVLELAYDPWQTTQLAQNLRKKGMLAVEVRQVIGNFSPAMREIEAAIAGGRLHHNDNPVMNWMASNVVAKADAKDNIFPRKEREQSKIDGIVALIMAVARAMYAKKTGSLQDFLDSIA